MFLTKRMMTAEFEDIGLECVLDTVLDAKFANVYPDEWNGHMLHANLYPELRWRRVCGKREDEDGMIVLQTRATHKGICTFIKRHKLAHNGDVYISQAKWLNPSRVPPKHRKNYGRGYWQNVVIGCDMCVDVDYKDYAMFCKLLDFQPYLVVNTNRGFQAWFAMLSCVQKRMPEKRQLREQYFTKVLAEYVEEMQKYGIKADWKCTLDFRHVFRLAGTLHRKGSLCGVLYSKPDACLMLPTGNSRGRVVEKTESVVTESPTLDDNIKA